MKEIDRGDKLKYPNEQIKSENGRLLFDGIIIGIHILIGKIINKIDMLS